MGSGDRTAVVEYSSLLAEAKLDVVARLAKRPALLFHYTSAEACFSILHTEPPRKKPRLWASSAFYTNDASEVEYGLNLVRQMAPGIVPSSDIERAFAPHYKRGKCAMLARLEGCSLVCFCAVPDLLSQWRAYAVNGAGYAIGFTTEAIAAAGAQCEFDLVPVIYDTHEQEEAVRMFFLKAEQIRSSVAEEERFHYWYQAIHEAVELAVCFKDKGFREEQEWRLVAVHPLAIRKYRVGRWGFIPYVEIPFEKACVTEIWQGPTLGHEYAQYTLESYLEREYGTRPQALGGSVVQVHRSAVPCRSL